jgi:hypothetical protein
MKPASTKTTALLALIVAGILAPQLPLRGQALSLMSRTFPQVARLTSPARDVPEAEIIAPRPAVPSADAQAEAVGKHPELGRAGSPFNREFLARMNRRRAATPVFFADERWPLALADEVAAAGFASFAHSPVIAGTPQRDWQLLPSAPEWRFLRTYREGDDIVVPRAIATVFGWDTRLGVRDPNDNGRCASGVGTLKNPGLLGCALPVSCAVRSTAGSPFPKSPWLPWFTPVVVSYNGRTITVPLIDNGPSAPKPGDSAPAGIDLTPAACLALGIPLEDIRRNRVVFNVSFRVQGAGRSFAWNREFGKYKATACN